VRDRLVVVLALVVLGGTVAGGWQWMARLGSDEPPPPEAAALAWASAWNAGDAEAMGAVLDTTVGLTQAVALFEPLDPTTVDVRVTGVVAGEHDGLATATFSVNMLLRDAGDWSWSTSGQLQRSRGTWRLNWDSTLLHPALTRDVRLERRDVTVPRAPILARDGRALTSQGDLIVVGIEPRRISDLGRLRARLAELLPEAVSKLDETMAREDLVETWFYPLVTVPELRIADIEVQVDGLPGIILRTEEGRVAADDDFAVHTLGRVGPASQEQADARGLQPGDEVGRSGLEAVYDAQLRGGSATEVVAIEPDGDVRAVLAVLGPGAGHPLATSLDVDVQLAIERSLRGVQDRVAIVAVDSIDGGLLGVASRPTIGYHRALAGRYPPGGAGWAVTLLAAIEAGYVADRTVECPDVAVVGGVRFSNPDGLGRGMLSLEDAIAAECRATVAGLARHLEDADLREWAGALGLVGTPGLALEVATAQWPASGDLAELAAASVGQGRVLATPLHLASAAAAIQGGEWHAPWLVEADRDASPPLVLRSATAAELRRIMATTATAAGLPPGAGALVGQSVGPEGDLAWTLVTSEGIGAVVLVEGGRTADAVRLADRFLDELAALRT